MTLNRRWFLKALVAVGLSHLSPKILFASPFQPSQMKNMEALTDTVMPGAKDLGIHEKVKETVLQRPDVVKACIAGLEALEKYSLNKYGKPFYLLKQEERETVLKRMDKDERREDRWKGFLFNFRLTVITHYYTSPEVWKTLKYNGPPQPRGFMDYHLPPKGRNE